MCSLDPSLCSHRGMLYVAEKKKNYTGVITSRMLTQVPLTLPCSSGHLFGTKLILHSFTLFKLEIFYSAHMLTLTHTYCLSAKANMQICPSVSPAPVWWGEQKLKDEWFVSCCRFINILRNSCLSCVSSLFGSLCVLCVKYCPSYCAVCCGTNSLSHY